MSNLTGIFGQGFNADEVPLEERELLPAGQYMVLVESSEVAETKSGTGTMLKVTLNVIDGPYTNRKIFWNINIQNQNEVAQGIGQRQLAQLCHAVGKIWIQDSSELHLIPFIARVAIKQDKTGNYSDQNEVKEAKPVSGAAPQTHTQAAVQRPAPTPKPAAAKLAAANSTRPAWAPGK
jgi:hypothetical protein